MTAFAWAVVAVFSLGCLLLGFWVGWQTGREHGYEEHRRETLEQMASAEPMDPPDGELIWLRAYDGQQWWSYHRDGPWHPYPLRESSERGHRPEGEP